MKRKHNDQSDKKLIVECFRELDKNQQREGRKVGKKEKKGDGKS